jgi:Uncharacterized protein conserved in bacteria
LGKKVRPWMLTLLAFCFVFPVFSGTAFGASDRYAVVTEAAGTVTVKKAGGALNIRVYPGMTLHEGDWISVGPGGHLVLQTDLGDEIMLGENWRGTLSKLRTNDQDGTETAVKAWSGSMYNHVQKKTDPYSTFKVEPPSSVANVRGTHFLVTIDPKTGLPRIIVNAGLVETGSNSPDGQGVLLLPSQQATIYPWLDNWTDNGYIDPEDITVSVSNAVLAKMLKNKALIDEENRELLDNIDELDVATDLNLIEEEILARYRAAVENSLTQILKAAAQSGRLDDVMLEDIMEAVKQTIKEENRQYDLDRDIPPIDRTAGIDPEVEEQRRQKREQAEREREERAREKEDKTALLKEKEEGIQQRLEEKKREQEEANRRAEEEKQNKAKEEYRRQLDEEQRNLLDEKAKQREDEKMRMDKGIPASHSPSSGTNQPEEPTAPSTPENPPTPSTPPVSPVATLTTVIPDPANIVYGQPFTLEALVTAANSQTVPDGGTVEFKIESEHDSFVIGSGAITNGEARLTVDEDMWAGSAMAGVGIGEYTVSATYAGVPQQFAGSTSAGAILTVVKANTEVQLAANTETAEPGGTVTFEANVAVKAPGGGKPEGTVRFYQLVDDLWQPIGEKSLEAGMQTVTFDRTIPLDEEWGPALYKAKFVSENGLHNDSESEEQEVIIGPVVYITKVPVADSPNSFEIRIDLANFTVSNAVYGAKFYFRHNLSTYEPNEIQDFSGEYNSGKFGIDHDDEHYFGSLEGYDPELERQVWGLKYEFSPSGNGVKFSEKEYMAKIVVHMSPGKSFDDAIIDLVYFQIQDAEGNPIVPVVRTGPGVNVKPDKNPFIV